MGRPEGDSGHTTAIVDAPVDLDYYEGESLLPPGTQVHQAKLYEIIEPLGEGGMGRVYRAYDPNMDRYIALKVLKEGVPDDERKRFEREAKVSADFSHPNLVRVLDVGISGDVQWMAMEYLRGRDIAHVLERGRKANFRLLLDIFGQALDGLDYIHTRGIVHCDIKPENIFITRDVYDRRLILAKLIDFGIARDLSGPLELQRYLMGDPRYMPPEQAVLNGPVDGRADLYALGMSFYELVAGVHPWEHLFEPDDPHAILALHREQALPPLSMFLPPGTPVEMSAALDYFCAKACAKMPEGRFENANAMKFALRGLASRLAAAARGG